MVWPNGYVKRRLYQAGARLGTMLNEVWREE
jgi:hypothetical protein